MSPVDSILGFGGLAIERAQRRDDIHVWARPRQRPTCVHCNGATVRIKATYLRTVKHTRVGDRLMVLHIKVPKYRCKQCNRFFCHRFPGIRTRYGATESYMLEVDEAHEGGVS